MIDVSRVPSRQLLSIIFAAENNALENDLYTIFLSICEISSH